MRGARVWGAGIVALAALLTLTRLPFRWNQIALAYAAYFREYRHIIEVDGWPAAFTTFVGIHPPAYSLLFLSMMESAPLTWFLVSGAFSVAAVICVFLTGRTRSEDLFLPVTAGLLLATSPHRLAYALEPNNYPLLLLATAAACLGFARWVRGGSPWPLLAVTVLGLWTHALFVTVPVAQALAVWPDVRLRRASLAGLGIAFVGCLPLLPAVLGAAGSTVNEAPPVIDVLAALFVVLPRRYGTLVAAWTLVGLAVLGAGVARADVVGRSWILQLGVGLAVLVFALLRGTASTWQFPYYLVLLPPLLLLAATGVIRAGQLWQLGVPLLLMVLGLNVGWAAVESARAHGAWTDATATHGLVAQAVEEWEPGSSLVAIHFPDYSDDDKDALDPAFAHISMRTPIALVDPDVPTLVGSDPYWGQPVRYPEERWLYTFTAVEPERLTAIVEASSAPVGVVVWNTHVAPKEMAELEMWAAGYSRRPQRGPSQSLWVFPR